LTGLNRALLAIALAAVVAGSAATRADGQAPAPVRLELVAAWGSTGAGNGQLNQPLSIALAPAGDLYVADSTNSRIQEFTSAGEFVRAWGSPGAGNGQFGPNSPSGIGVDGAGNVYAADRANARVQKFRGDGTYVRKWGTPGRGPGQFLTPQGLGVDRPGTVHVADSGANRVQTFTDDGVFVRAWGTAGSAPGEFDRPVDAATDAAGNVYVLDQLNNRVQKFTAAAVLVTAWSTAEGGSGELPSGIGVGANGFVYVADAARIQKFDANGTRVATFAGTTDGGSFRAVDVAVDAAGVLYVVEFNRVLKLREVQGPPPPEVGKTVNVGPVSGIVRFRVPGTIAFVDLVRTTQVPVGAELDTTRGRVGVTAARGGGRTERIEFYEGRFVVSQPAAGAGVPTLKLTAPLRCTKRSKKGERHLWGSGTGTFRTRGLYAAATVRGTTWLTQDRCGVTVVRVREGIVDVADLVRRRTVVVSAGRQYVAKSRAKRR